MVAKRTVLVTGGTGKVGRAIVSGILSQGDNVILAVRDVENSQLMIEEYGWSKINCVPHHLDLLNPEGYQTLERHSIDAVIHCARTLESLQIGPDLSVALDHWVKEMTLGVIAPYELSRILRKGTKLKDVIFINSMYGMVGPTPRLYADFEKSSPVQYGVVKAAQLHLVKELAVRFAPIRVNAVSYGGFKGRTDVSFEQRYSELNPLGRMLSENDVYGPIEMILKNPDMAMTGQNIVVDGGWTVW